MFHVATAIHLGAEKFLTFDDRQKRLAGYAGLVARKIKNDGCDGMTAFRFRLPWVATWRDSPLLPNCRVVRQS